jgi:hypothetical protein
MEILKKIKDMIGMGDTAAAGQDLSKQFAVNSQILTGFQDLVASLQPKGQEEQGASDEEFLNRLRKEGGGR